MGREYSERSIILRIMHFVLNYIIAEVVGGYIVERRKEEREKIFGLKTNKYFTF